ncbi:MAG: hypothetical protein ACR2O5_09690 [Thiogranum sp.]
MKKKEYLHELVHGISDAAPHNGARSWGRQKSPGDTSVILDVRQGDAHIKRSSSIAMDGVNRQSDHGKYAVSLSVKVRTWQSIDWQQHGAG